jgi:hypothetical protein
LVLGLVAVWNVTVLGVKFSVVAVADGAVEPVERVEAPTPLAVCKFELPPLSETGNAELPPLSETGKLEVPLLPEV